MKKLKVLAAALLASVLPLSGCSVLGVEIPGSQAIMDLLNKVDIFDIIPDKKDDKEDGDDDHDHDHDGDDEDEKKVNNVRVEGTNKVKVGATVKLTAQVSADEGVATTVTWKSETPAVATVAADGTVTGVSAGTAKIVATSTADPTKSGYLVVTVEELSWTATEKAMMQTAIGQEIPFISGSWTFNDEFLDSHGALIIKSTDSGALIKAKEAFNADTANFTYAGTEHDDKYNCDDYYYVGKESTQLPGYQGFIDIYEIQGETTIEMYMNYIKYEEWPTQQIATYGAVLGLTNLTLPAYEIEEGYYNAAPEQLTSGGACVFVAVNDGESYASYYVELFSEDDYYIYDYDDEFIISPKTKEYSIVVYDSDYGFEILVVDYIEDANVNINEIYELLALGDTLQLTYTLGIDVPEGATVTFESKDETIATVDNLGLVTPVAEGSATIIAKIDGEEAGGTVVHVVEEIKTEWSTEDIAEFNKFYECFTIPFNKYFDTVSYDEEEACLLVSSNLYSLELLGYMEALEADDWVDTLGAFADLYYAFGYPYMYEKEFVIGEQHVWPTIEVCSLAPYEDEDGQVELSTAYEGYLSIAIYDSYIYSFAEAATELTAALAEMKIETTAEFPEIAATHYSVFITENYNEEEYIEFDALGVDELTAAQVVAALEEKGWLAQSEHYEADVELDEPECDVIVASSEDGALYIEGELADGNLCFSVYGGEGGGGEEESAGAEFDFAEITETSGEANGFSFTTAKASGQSDPAHNANQNELRLYANNTITFTSDETMTSIFFDANTCGESKATGTIVSASVGTVSAVEGGFLWEGEANEVTLTASASGQVHINSIVINGGGEGGGTIDIDIDVDAALEDIEDITVAIAAKYLKKSESSITVDYGDGDADVYVWDYSDYGFICSDFSITPTGNEQSDLAAMKAALPSGVVLDTENTFEEDDYHDIWYTYGDYSIGIYYYDGEASFAVVPTEMLEIYFSMMYGE